MGDGDMRTVISGHRELRVWQASMDLVEQVYHVCADFPPDERFGLTSQLRRAAVSIPSNLAEGHRRESTKEYLNGISMAQGSLAEVETQLEIAARLQYLSGERLGAMLETTTVIAKQLFALRNSLTKKL
jgi:four helix bundle protein